MSSKTKVNIDQLKEITNYIIDNNLYLQEHGKVPVTLNIEGDAGLGKTSAISQVAKERGMQYVRLNLAMIEELGDLVGFPIKQFEVCLKDGQTKKCEWISEAGIDEYLKASYHLTGRSQMSYAAPEWIVGIDQERGGILLLDDYTRADPRFMQACMTLIETQKYLSWALPKGWTILLSTNPDNGDYNVTSLDSAQKTRFATLDLQFDIKCWARWAEQNQIDTRCINFLLMHPELVTQKVNARSITTFFNTILSIKDFGGPQLPMIQLLGEGSVGDEFATLFTMFINNKLDRLMSPEDILLGGDNDHVVNTLKSSIGNAEKQTYRADIASTIATRIVNYSAWYADKNPVPDSMISRIANLITSNIFSSDLRYNIAKQIWSSNQTKFKALMMNKDVMSYILKG